jgi:hypothetical protein
VGSPSNARGKIASGVIEKGLKSLGNPVLRGSFILVLSEEDMNYFDKIALFYRSFYGSYVIRDC